MPTKLWEMPYAAQVWEYWIGVDVTKENYQQPKSFRMNRKKIHPSEADLRESIIKCAVDLINTPTKEEIVYGEWFTIKELAGKVNYGKDAIRRRLKKRVELGEVEEKIQKCRVGNAVVSLSLFRIIPQDEIARPY